MGKGKIVYFGTTLIDLTADTVTADKILANYTAHGADGEAITGTCDYDVNSQDATVKVAEILEGSTAYARGTKMVGTMPNNSGASYTINTVSSEVTIPQGYTDGTTKVGILSTEKAKLIASNIKKGIQILGVTGTLEPSSSVTVQTKTVTPSTSSQTIVPDTGYDYLSQVTVNKVPYVETQNAAGGTTVTIG